MNGTLRVPFNGTVPLGLLGGPQAPQVAGTPQIIQTPNGPMVVQGPTGQGDGSLFGGGQAGINDQSVNRMGAGRAPFTGAGLLAAGQNAMGILGGGAVTMGVKSMAEQALGKTPGTFGGLQNIPGQTPYDRDLIDAVQNGMPISRADAQQAQRNAARQSAKFAAQDSVTARGQRGIGAFKSFNDYADAYHASTGGGSMRGGYGGGISGGGNATAGGWGGEKI